jgi:hypothetical protein
MLLSSPFVDTSKVRTTSRKMRELSSVRRHRQNTRMSDVTHHGTHPSSDLLVLTMRDRAASGYLASLPRRNGGVASPLHSDWSRGKTSFSIRANLP